MLQLRSLRSGKGSIWRIFTDIKKSADNVAFVTYAWCKPALGAIGGPACSGVLEQMPIELHGAGLRVSAPLKDVRPWCLAQGVWLWQFCQKDAGGHFVELWQCSSAPPSTKEQISVLLLGWCSSTALSSTHHVTPTFLVSPQTFLRLCWQQTFTNSIYGCAPILEELESLCNLNGLQVPCHTTSSEQDTEFHFEGAKEGEINSQWFVFHNVTYRYPPEV